MRLKQELVPQVTKKNKTEFLITFWYNGKRYRFSNGKSIDINLSPNKTPIKGRLRQAEVLCSAFTMAIRDSWRPSAENATKSISIGSIAKITLKRKLSMDYSKSYKNDLIYTEKLWAEFLKSKKLDKKMIENLTVEMVRDFIFEYAPSPSSMANYKRNISSLLKDELESNGVILNLSRIKLPKQAQELHKPIKDVPLLLQDITLFNENLFLCCLMTYSMLLRPHREIRCLRFSDFNKDFKLLSLDGSRVKSKRNRILPVPEAVRKEILQRFQKSGDRDANLFSLQSSEFNYSYFKGLWTKYKRQSRLLEPKQTLYSLRHSAALKVFEKTGSLQKLQQVMGHSDMKVSLTYLRGLEVKQLDVEDLPEL